MMAKYASKRAGIGLEIGRIRPVGAPIRNGENQTHGYDPIPKEMVCRSTKLQSRWYP
jgi:hypothetical protein